jgi:hypothetical protein
MARGKHQFGEAAVGEVVVGPAARVAVDQGAQRHRQGGAVADHQHPLVVVVALVDLLHGRHDALGHLAQGLAAGRGEVVIAGGDLDEAIALGQLRERRPSHSPMAYSRRSGCTSTSRPRLAGDDFLAVSRQRAAGWCRWRRPGARCGDEACGAPHLTAAAPGQRAVGGAVPAALRLALICPCRSSSSFAILARRLSRPIGGRVRICSWVDLGRTTAGSPAARAGSAAGVRLRRATRIGARGRDHGHLLSGDGSLSRGRRGGDRGRAARGQRRDVHLPARLGAVAVQPGAGDVWLPVPEAAVADVVAAARTLSEQSDGAFDVTVGPLVNLWGFGPEHRHEHPGRG